MRLALGAGASFVARTTTCHMREMVSIFKKALEHNGFSVVEVLTQCPAYFGRKNKLGDAVDMMRAYRDETAPVGSPKLGEDPALIPRGIFTDEEYPEYCDRYGAISRPRTSGVEPYGQRGMPWFPVSCCPDPAGRA